MIAQPVHSLTENEKNKIMIARKWKCLTTTKQQKQKHDGTKSSFIYKKQKLIMIARNVHHVTKKRP